MNAVLHGYVAAMMVMAAGTLYAAPARGQEGATGTPDPDIRTLVHTAEMLHDYMHLMTAPRPLEVLQGPALLERKAALRQKILTAMNLDPLPERLPLDLHYSESLDHPWCTVWRVSYQLWPNVYTDGLLYMPKAFPEKPSAGILAPYGHWKEGNADPHVQTRCLTFAKLGYPVFSPRLNHYEDLNLGISHQTVITWTTMRALDVLQSLPEVDPARLGSAGASGGGMQTQFLAALDDRLGAGTIVGYTSLFADITEPGYEHCGCNHWPGVMRFMDMTELAIAAFPTPVQYITMNDWTREFQWMHFPAIAKMYEINGYAGRARLYYEPTEHMYNHSKREWTYWWMNRWLRGSKEEWPPEEPEDVQTFAPEILHALKAEAPGDRGLNGISEFYAARDMYTAPEFATVDEWRAYRGVMLETLGQLLGMQVAQPSWLAGVEHVSSQSDGEILEERINVPTEAGIRIPTVILRPKQAGGLLPVVVLLAEGGNRALLESTGPDSALGLAQQGSMVVLPDIRFVGDLDLTRQQGQNSWSWRRSAIIWGRPFSGMAATDIQRTLDHVLSRDDADAEDVTLVARGSGSMAAAALFATILDPRVHALDADFTNLSYTERYRVPVPYKHEALATVPYLPEVPFILRHGDVYQWAALLGDRELTLRNVHSSAGDPAWLRKVFAIAGHGDQLKIVSPS